MNDMLIMINEVWLVLKNDGSIFAVFSNEQAALKAAENLTTKIPENVYRVEKHEVFEEY